MPMHGPSLAETTAFVAVVELKSFTKAAKQLALSPPRVSEMVRNLEDRLDVRFVERATRSVAPTVAGERLLARLRPALDEYQAALESTNEFRGKPAGTLRLTAPQPAADFFLASAIPRFLTQYPEISLNLSVSDTLTDIVAERFDAGIRLGERIERDMIAVRVTDELPLVVAGSPAYFEQRGKPKKPEASPPKAEPRMAKLFGINIAAPTPCAVRPISSQGRVAASATNRSCSDQGGTRDKKVDTPKPISRRSP
jgi:LysR family transcriptional regulator, regulator of peptidoglycan recycling